MTESRRSGKRQAAPSFEGEPNDEPAPPGRKWGDAHARHGHRMGPDQPGPDYPNVHGDVMATVNATGAKPGTTLSYDPYGQALSGLPDNSVGNVDFVSGWDSNALSSYSIRRRRR